MTEKEVEAITEAILALKDGLSFACLNEPAQDEYREEYEKSIEAAIDGLSKLLKNQEKING